MHKNSPTPPYEATSCIVCKQDDCYILNRMVKEFGLDANGWTIEPAARLEIGLKTKTVTLPKLSLLSDPGYEHNDDLASIVRKTTECNNDYRRCYLEGYFEVLAVLGADLNNFVKHNFWAKFRIYFVRTAKTIGEITLVITTFAGKAVLSIVAPPIRLLLASDKK